MSPFQIATVLFTPGAVIALLAVVLTSAGVMYLLAPRALRKLGWRGLASGYGFAAIAMIPLSAWETWPSIGDAAEAFITLTFAAWLVLALAIFPMAVLFLAKERLDLVSVLGSAFATALILAFAERYIISPDVGEASAIRWAHAVIQLAAFTSVVSLGFLVGARIAMAMRVQVP